MRNFGSYLVVIIGGISFVVGTIWTIFSIFVIPTMASHVSLFDSVFGVSLPGLITTAFGFQFTRLGLRQLDETKEKHQQYLD